MDQEKIGKFIAKLRKDHNMTQQELADRLNVTDRAVSHWENGRRFPDVSLFKPICEIFDISVNELISGETLAQDEIVEKSDEHIIHTLHDREKQQRKSKIIIGMLLLSMIVLITIVIVSIQNKYPKIDLYNFTISPADSDKPYTLTKVFSHHNRNIYFYGIDSALFYDLKENYYPVVDALKHDQTTLNKVQDYLEKQAEYENVEISMLYDGGTTIYKKAGMTVIYCNTTNGNHDVYIGNSEMLDHLNGQYCGHEENPNQSYIRTYQVISSVINKDNPGFNDVLLEQNNEERGSVIISNTYLLIPGKTYEFSFLTFDQFDDTIENIFQYSTLLKVIETDKSKEDYINGSIIVNDIFDHGEELNDLEHVTMTIKNGTLTTRGATIMILDLSGNQYMYGSDFRLDKKENGIWHELENQCDNCVFNSMAYGPDLNGWLQFDIDWEKMYGNLSNGQYRIVKSALSSKENCHETKCHHYYLSVEFTID